MTLILSLAFQTLLPGCAVTGPGRRGETGRADEAAGDGGVEYSVSGVVSLGHKGHAGATVELYRLDDFPSPTPPEPVAKAKTGELGRFTLYAPRGSYIITAEDDGLFGFFGRNPLRVGADQSGVSIPLAAAHALDSNPVAPGEEGVSGTLLRDGEPVKDGLVYAYLDGSKGFKGPPYMLGEPTGENGRYHLQLEPGRYFITAKKRKGGGKTGPLYTGDLFGMAPAMVVQVNAGYMAVQDISLVELPDPEQMARYVTDFAEISGTVKLRDGAPVAGFRLCVYDNPMMLDEPVKVSAPTGPDGRFTLKTSVMGNYWLGARERLGGPPLSGERVGFMRPSPPNGVKIEPGLELDDVEIIVSVMP